MGGCVMFQCTARVAPEKAVFRPALPPHPLPGLYGAGMTKMTYGEQLKHPNWQRKRLKVLEAAGFSCSACRDKDSTLHVHHKRYIKGRLAWEYEDEELLALCESCHAEEHSASELIDEMLACTGGDYSKQWVAAFLGGVLFGGLRIDADCAKRAAKVEHRAFERGVLAQALGMAGAGQLAYIALGLYGGSIDLLTDCDPLLAVFVASWEAEKGGDK